MEAEPLPATELIPQNPIRVETALRYPIHRLARKGSIEISIHEGTRPGEVMSWEVDYSKKHGQPGPLAYKLDTLIINRRIEEARRPIPRLLKLGSLTDICRQLNMADSGKNRADIKNSLFQNAFSGITAKIRYRQADGSERTLEAAFTRYSVILTGEKLPDGTKADAVYIALNDVFIRIINGAMTRPLDYDYLKSLPPAPQRFYQILSFQMYFALKYDRPRAKLTYSEFCAHAPQTRHTDWERVRSQMSKVHRPHLQSGYIAKIESEPTTDSDGNPDWIFFYLPGLKARVEFKAFTKRGGPNVLEIEPLPLDPPAPAEPQPSELEAELIRRGVAPAVTAELVRGHSEEKIRAQIERLDWYTEKKPGKIDNPAAYLVEAIKSDYVAPKGFISKAERQRRAEVRQAKEREAAEERHRQQQEAARERALNEEVDAYRQSLTPEQLAQVEANALAQAGEEERHCYDDPAMARYQKTLQHKITDDYIRRIVQARKHPAADA